MLPFILPRLNVFPHHSQNGSTKPSEEVGGQVNARPESSNGKAAEEAVVNNLFRRHYRFPGKCAPAAGFATAFVDCIIHCVTLAITYL